MVIRNRQVETGPSTAEANVGAIQICGWRIILENCSIEVPMPWLIRPPQPFSRKLATAKPTI